MKATLIIALLAFGLTSCTTELTPENLQGKWSVIEFTADIPQLAPQVIEDGKAIALSTTYTFLEDGQSIRDSSYEKGEKGEWDLNTDENILRIGQNVEDGMNETFFIIFFSGASMVWEQKLGANLGTIEMVLEKN